MESKEAQRLKRVARSILTADLGTKLMALSPRLSFRSTAGQFYTENIV